MIVARSLAEVAHDVNSVVTVGTFDGVHLGHRTIIGEVVSRTNARKGRGVVVTFEPHPREIVGRGPVKLLSTIDERLMLLEHLGVHETLVLEFTYQFSRQTSQEFYEKYVVKGIGVSEVIVGFDHMFGRDREAGVKELEIMGRKYGFTTIAVPQVALHGETVSSSRIRELLLRGEVDRASQFLAAPYSLGGTVVRGDGRGALLGFPTANIKPEYEHKLIPAEGVYFVRARIASEQYHGMLNIGVRPTFRTDFQKVLEVHIFDFHETIYGETITIYFLKRLRSEKKFSSKDELIMQLETDRNECLKQLTSVQLS